MTLLALHQQLTAMLREANIEQPAQQAKLLLCHLLPISPAQLPLHWQQPVDAPSCQRLLDAAQRRVQGWPLQYLAGCWGFFTGEFFVGPGVLIPRPDTECLVEIACARLRQKPAATVADLCSGSGCIAISIAQQYPAATVYALEYDPQAFAYLQKNIQHNGVSQVIALPADVLNPPQLPVCDLIVSNPPYIPTDQLPTLQREVRMEPEIALDGGADGLRFYRAIAQLYHPLLAPDGMLAFEVGFDQAQAVSNILTQNGYRNIQIHRDYAGIQRVVCAEP